MQNKLISPLQQTLKTAHGLRVFKSLKGAWQFSRAIKNHLTPACSGVMHGTAEFTQQSNQQYALHERGIFNTQNHDIQSRNTFIYRYNSDKHSISVYSTLENSINNLLFELYFTDALHNKLTSIAQHQCGLDEYTAEFSLHYEHGITSLQIIYTVKGPNKNYTSTTTYHQLQS